MNKSVCKIVWLSISIDASYKYWKLCRHKDKYKENEFSENIFLTKEKKKNKKIKLAAESKLMAFSFNSCASINW